MKKAQMFYLDFFIAIGIFISGFLVFVLIFNSQNYSHNSLDEKLEVFSNEILNDKIISINMSFEEHQIFFIMNLNESINNNFEVKSFYGNCGNGIEVINSQKINLAYYGNNFRNINKSWINYTNFTTFDNLDYLIIDNETFISTKNLEDFVYSGKSVFIINSSNENLFEHNFSRGLFVNNEFLISKLSQDKNNTYRFLINSNVSWYKENESFGYGFQN